MQTASLGCARSTKEHLEPLLQPQSSFWSPENGDIDKNSKPTSQKFLKIWIIFQFASDSFELNHLDLNLTCVKASFKLCEAFC